MNGDVEKLSPQRQHLTTPGTNAIISEIMVVHDLFSDEDGETSDWIEIYNAEAGSVDFTVTTMSNMY